jgi:tetratricopeptide (TPR) repeat protein
VSEAPSASAIEKLQSASALLRARRPSDAASALRALLAQEPDLAEGHRLLGAALQESGDSAGAEAQFRKAAALDPFGRAPVALGELLMAAGNPAAALAALSKAAHGPAPDLAVLTAYGDALKATGALDDAIAAYGRAARSAPFSAAAEHNHAAALGDGEYFPESEAAARRAISKGGQAPETYLVLARALRALGRYDEAEQAFRAAIQRRPLYADAQGELAQLIWMRTGDAAAAAAPLDAALRAYPTYEFLYLKKAELLEYAGDVEGAYAVIAAALAQSDDIPVSHIMGVRLKSRSDPRRALAHAERAIALAPNERAAQSALAEACLASGLPERAAQVAEQMRASAPLDQHAIGYLATAWRLLGDRRYASLYDYEHFVRAWRIDTPEGWPNLEAYLASLAASLTALHTLPVHPVGQSLRHGSQTSSSLMRSQDPAIRAFFKAIDGPIRRHIAHLGAGDDVLRARNTSKYRLNGIWSVRLNPKGYHVDHLHPMGWLSSACYIALPKAVEKGREGWLKFGEPGVATAPKLDPEHFVKPEPGMLVLFPSYMWHGTAPFGGKEPRLTIAFDVAPG